MMSNPWAYEAYSWRTKICPPTERKEQFRSRGLEIWIVENDESGGFGEYWPTAMSWRSRVGLLVTSLNPNALNAADHDVRRTG